MRPIIYLIVGLTLASTWGLGDNPSRDLQAKPRAVLDEPDYSDRSITLAFTGDSRILVSGGTPYSLKLWNVRTGKLGLDLEDPRQAQVPHVSSVSVSSDGKFLAVGSTDGIIQLWDTQDLTKRKLLRHCQTIT